jgi:hypothetical protein
MTMLIGIHTGDSVWLAADKRAVYKEGNKVISIVSDNVDKLVSWSGGYITGNGYVDLIDILKNKIRSTNITSTSQIIEMVSDLNNELDNIPGDFTKQTRWVISLCSGTEEVVTPKIGYIEPFSDNVNMLTEGSCLVWNNMPEHVLLALQVETEKHVRRIDSFDTFSDAVTHYNGLFQQLFKLGSSHDETVSKEFEFSVVLSDGEKADSFS